MNGDLPIPIPKVEWTDIDLVVIEFNTKAHYTLTCALSSNKYTKIYRLKTTKEIWDLLSINYEGTKYDQLRKVVTLTRHYERFSMKEEETMDDMFERL